MNPEAKSTNPDLKTTSSIKSTADRAQKGGTLRSRLLLSIVPAVLLPLVVASAIGYTVTESRAKAQVLEELESNAVLASSTLETFIKDSFELTNLVGSNPFVVQLMKEGEKKAQEQKLTQQSIEEVEKKFAATKLLTPNDNLNTYLEEVVKSSQAAEVFFTDSNGFNLAFSNPTSDFVQRDEEWWQTSQKEGKHIDKFEFDQSANTYVIAFSQAVKDPQSGKLLGVIKAGVPLTKFNSQLSQLLDSRHRQRSSYQIIDSSSGSLVSNIDQSEEHEHDEHNHGDSEEHGAEHKEMTIEGVEIIGGETIQTASKILAEIIENSSSLAEAEQLIAQIPGLTDVYIHQEEIFSEANVVALFGYQDKTYGLSTIPNTDLVSVASMDNAEIAKAGQSLLTVFALTALVLGTVSVGLILLLAEQLSKPLTNLSKTTQQVAEGNLDITANLEGTSETRTLADNFNQLVSQVKNSLKEQTAIADEQRNEKEQLEAAIYTLLDEVGDATDGDLTVRANLDNLELSTVADLFNAIISSLHDIAIEAKESSGKVGSSLKQNEIEMRLLARQAIKEADETRNTLMSVEQLAQSIQEVSTNASQAEKIADATYNTIVHSTNNMDLTVESILSLRTTVDETGEKMERLDESSKQISEAISLIEGIALKTNVLAINAGAEAERAGEYGQGFAIVAEQVSLLAKQSTAALKEIARTVTVIQAETNEVNQAMKSGTTQVVETFRLVESTKESLSLALEKSRTINQLMESISHSTISQTTTSENVTNLMQNIAQLSEITSKSSERVAKSIVETANVAERLESTVSQFKVSESV